MSSLARGQGVAADHSGRRRKAVRREERRAHGFAELWIIQVSLYIHALHGGDG